MWACDPFWVEREDCMPSMPVGCPSAARTLQTAGLEQRKVPCILAAGLEELPSSEMLGSSWFTTFPRSQFVLSCWCLPEFAGPPHTLWVRVLPVSGLVALQRPKWQLLCLERTRRGN